MSRTFATLDAGDWAGTEQLTTELTRTRITNDSVYRVINRLDVGVTVTFAVTHIEDDTFAHAIETTSFTVAAEAANGTLLTEPWERIQIGVTPDLSPASGDVEVIGLGGL